MGIWYGLVRNTRNALCMEHSRIMDFDQDKVSNKD